MQKWLTAMQLCITISGMKSLKDTVQALLDLGLTQTKIAEDSGVTQPTISRVLSGNGVSYENGKKIESYYETVQRTAPSEATG